MYSRMEQTLFWCCLRPTFVEANWFLESKTHVTATEHRPPAPRPYLSIRAQARHFPGFAQTNDIRPQKIVVLLD